MLDRFEVFRNAEKMVQEWGPVDYVFPHIMNTDFKPGSRIGVIVDGTKKIGPTVLRYGHMQFGYSKIPSDKKGSPFIFEDSLLSGGTYQPIFKTRRCLIPVDRWYFHKRTSMRTEWFCFHPIEKISMAFAGLFHTYTHPNGLKDNSVGILGLSSNEFYRQWDDRMPAVFLPGPEAIEFLNPKTSESKALEILRSWPVDKIMAEPCDQYGPLGE